MRISRSQLILDLKEITRQNIQYVETLLQKTDKELTHRVSENSWSVLECIEHLNMYGNFYIPEITHKMASSNSTSKTTFSPGIIGNYFVKSMLPKKKPNIMKTFKSMNPIRRKLDKEVLKEFIRQQQQLLELLEKSQNIDIEETKTSISISKLIKLRLGDTLRFVIYHNVRHIDQAKKVLLSI